MKKYIWLLALYVVSLFFFLFQGGRSSIMLFSLLNLLYFYLALGYWNGIRKVTGVRHILADAQHEENKSMHAGQQLSVLIEVKVPSLIPIPYLEITDTFYRHDGTKIVHTGTAIPGFRKLCILEYTLSPLLRGEYKANHIDCFSYDVFGLRSYQGSIKLEEQFKVLPSLFPIDQWLDLMQGVRGYSVTRLTSNKSKESSQQSGIRDYHYGDRISKIHWNATARTGQWKSKDFEKESTPKTMIVLDRHALSKSKTAGSYMEESFEVAVSTVASIIEYGSNHYSSFGLYSHGQEAWYVEPHQGNNSYMQIMNHLTTVTNDCPIPLSDLLLHNRLEKLFFGHLFIVTSEIGDRMLSTLKALHRKGYSLYLFYIPLQGSKQTDRLTKIQMEGVQVFDVSAITTAKMVAKESAG